MPGFSLYSILKARQDHTVGPREYERAKAAAHAASQRESITKILAARAAPLNIHEGSDNG